MIFPWMENNRAQNLMEKCNRRASQVNSSDPNFASKLYEAMIYSNNEAETLGLMYGTIFSEDAPNYSIDKAVEYLKDDPLYSKLDEKDLRDLVAYFVDQGATSIVFAPDVLSSFLGFSKTVGFPATLGGAERAGLAAPRYETKALLRVLVGSHVLTVSEIPAIDAIDANHSGSEDLDFRKNPKMKVDVYEYDLGFIREVGHVLKQLGIRQEGLDQASFSERLEEKRQLELAPGKIFENLEKRLGQLTVLLGSEESEDESAWQIR